MRYYKNIDDPGTILTEDEAWKQWAEEYDGEDPTNPLRFYDQYKQANGKEAAIADIKHTIATHEPADSFKYMLLDRLRTDCEYFLGNGNRYAPYLWAGTVETHIESMFLLYDSFPEEDKPEWITRDDIEEYKERMNPQKGATE